MVRHAAADPHLITKSDALAEFCHGLAHAPFITIDTEFLREKTYWPILCLVQIAGPEQDQVAAIDTLAPGLDLTPLHALLNNTKVIKVFHAARQDVEIFFRLTGSIPKPIVDTQVLAMVCGFGDAASYETLASKLAGVRLDKLAGSATEVAPGATQLATKPVDFRTLTETSCPDRAASYQEWVAKFQAYALSKGRSADVIQTAFAGVKENPEISDRAAKQPEFVTPVWTYIERAVSDDRVARGQQKYQENKALLAEIERDYGVPRAIIMGIWGIETDFGNHFGDANVFEALTNLGYRANRQSFACNELLAALDIVAKNQVPASRMVGSWAGAMGHPQFLPSAPTGALASHRIECRCR